MSRQLFIEGGGVRVFQRVMEAPVHESVHQWSEVEPQLRSDWETSHPESTWEKVKDAVRYGAERVTGNCRH